MTEKPMTFDEFRASHHDLLTKQREHLRDDAVADGILRDGISWLEWVPWGDAPDMT